jgi:hypothetical protein
MDDERLIPMRLLSAAIVIASRSALALALIPFCLATVPSSRESRRLAAATGAGSDTEEIGVGKEWERSIPALGSSREFFLPNCDVSCDAEIAVLTLVCAYGVGALDVVR